MSNVEFLQLPYPEAPKDDPCFFRLKVSSLDGKTFNHDFLISTVLGTSQSELERLGRAIQERLKKVSWSDNPEADFDREISPLLHARELDSDSQVLAKERSPELGSTYTLIGIAGMWDCKHLIQRLR